MIHTLCLNPALDQTVLVDELTPGAVLRATSVRLDPGGKGVNVASCLADRGFEVTVHGLIGRENTAAFTDLFARKSIRDAMVPQPGATRTNIKLLETGGRTTDVNLPGFTAAPGAVDAVERGLAAVAAGEIVVISGSQPGGLPADTTARLSSGLIARGARVVLDVSGAPLDAALRASALPHAIKPNRHELEAHVGHPLTDRADLIAAAGGLCARGIGLVVVSLGTEGAVFLTAEGGVQAVPPVLATGSTVGAGDAMVAGIAAGIAAGLDLTTLARQATAFAAGKLRNAGPHLPPATEIDAIARDVAVQSVTNWVNAA